MGGDGRRGGSLGTGVAEEKVGGKVHLLKGKVAKGHRRFLVTTAEDIFCQDTRAGQCRCLNANIPPFYYKKVRWG